MTKRMEWIDFLKFLAIMAVLIHHTYSVLYDNTYILWSVYYSVSLFIIISGYNTYLSYNKAKYGFKKVLNKCWNIFLPYSVSVFLYEIISEGHFYLEDFLLKLFHFCASGPHYYVLLYLQLIVLGPLMSYLVKGSGKNKDYIYLPIVLAVLCVVSVFTTNNTKLLDVWGGGGVLAGGTYIILFFIGMVYAKYDAYIAKLRKASLVVALILCVVLIKWVIFIHGNVLQIDKMLPYGEGFNPPSISIGLEALLVFTIIRLLGDWLRIVFNNKLVKPIKTVVIYIGQHTLYIFLYHRLFLDYILPIFLDNIGQKAIYSNIWLRRFIVMGCMIGGSLLIELFLKMARRFINKCYDDRAISVID